jgi:site-specific recombinase XerD
VRGTLARVDVELVVTDTKTNKSKRTVPLSSVAVGILREVRQRQLHEQLAAVSKWVKTPFLFTTAFGEPCDPRNTLRAVKSAAKSAGLLEGVGLHTLRQSAATVVMTNGVPLKMISNVLEHGSAEKPAGKYCGSGG